MRTPLLLVSTMTDWLGTARIPRALAQAGFSVDLLTPRGSLAETSRYLHALHSCDVRATPHEFERVLLSVLRKTAPRVIVPCDDMAFRVLAELALRAPAHSHAVPDAVRTLIVESLGDPRHYRASVDKTRLPQMATALGVDVPAHAIVDDASATLRFAAAEGYPVVVKRGHGFGGGGVAICRDAVAVESAIRAFDAANRDDPLASGAAAHLVQKWIGGRTQYFQVTAHDGEIRAGWALEKLVADPHPTGPPTVARYFHSPRLEAITQRLVRGGAMSGFLFAEFIVDADDRPWLLEVNRRVSPATARGELRNADLCQALHSAVTATPNASRSRLADDENVIAVHFPQEWLRDPGSQHLLDYPADVPWDEPELLRGMLRLRDK